MELCEATGGLFVPGVPLAKKKKSSCIYFFVEMMQRGFVMILATVWSMGIGRPVTCIPCILLTRNVNGNAEIFLPAFSVDALTVGLPPGPCWLECFLECPGL